LQGAIERARSERLHLREAVSRDADLSQALQDASIGPEQLARAFEPSGYLGSSAQFIERALALHASRRSG
jgi:DNA-binding phage protein